MTSPVARASPPEGPAGGHAADEDAGIERVGLHPDAVAEHGAAGERARGIDGDHAHRGPLRAQQGDETVDHGGFPGTGRAGDPHDIGAAGFVDTPPS